jgi:MFS family permease
VNVSLNIEHNMPLSQWQVSVYVAMLSVGGLLGGLASGVIMNTAGRRGALLATCVPSLLGWLMTGERLAVAWLGEGD